LILVMVVSVSLFTPLLPWEKGKLSRLNLP